ncbi:MAG: pilus assembly protein [Acidobacteria bacterium]|nr:pilus assembly protein [Acidobacteriota bacterium]
MIRNRKSHRRPSRLPKARGAGQVEFILSILTILFLLFAMWEIIMIVYTMNVLSDAAKEGVRYAIVHGGGNINCSGPNPSADCTNPDPAAARVIDVVKDYARFSLHDTTAIGVNVNYPDGLSTSPARVRVEVSYDFVPYTALNLRPTLRAAAEGRIVF